MLLKFESLHLCLLSVLSARSFTFTPKHKEPSVDYLITRDFSSFALVSVAHTLLAAEFHALFIV